MMRFSVPTVAFRVLYVFLVLRHDRRRIVHFNVTTNPTVQWIAQQIVEAFPYDQTSRFLLRDRATVLLCHLQSAAGPRRPGNGRESPGADGNLRQSLWRRKWCRDWCRTAGKQGYFTSNADKSA